MSDGAQPWWRGRLASLDFETTSANPHEARIVTAALALVGGGQETEVRTWLSDVGGEEVPEQARAIHGVTTEKARAEGQPAAEVVRDVLNSLDNRLPLVIYNAPYDLTVLDRETRRYMARPLLAVGNVVCPLTIDRFLDRYRKGSRRLEATCQHYADLFARKTGHPMRELLSDAHDAGSDALAAARLAYVIGEHGEVVRRVRNRSEAIEKHMCIKVWEDVKPDLARLHGAQQRWAIEERQRFAAYKRSIGEHSEADRIEAERGWPVLELPQPSQTAML